MNEPNKIPPYVIFPKYIASDFKSGKLTPNEWKLYTWLRLDMNPYGITSTGVSSIQDDIFKDVTRNYIEKLLLSLRSKKYLYFVNRQGRRGSFEVRFGDLITPDGVIVSITHYFDDKEVISEEEPKLKENTPAGNNLEVESHKLIEQKDQLVKQFSINPERRLVIGSYNEHNNEPKNKKYDTTLGTSFKGTLVREFNPNTEGEYLCKKIALELGEEYMNPLLKVLRTDGIGIIERSWRIYEKDVESGKVIQNPPAYFQGLIKKLRQEL